MSLTSTRTAADDGPDAWRGFTDADAHRDRIAADLTAVLDERSQPGDAAF